MVILKVAQQVIKLVVIGVGALTALSTLAAFSFGIVVSLGILGIALLLIGVLIGYYGVSKEASQTKWPDAEDDTAAFGQRVRPFASKNIDTCPYCHLFHQSAPQDSFAKYRVEKPLHLPPMVCQNRDVNESDRKCLNVHRKTFKVR